MTAVNAGRGRGADLAGAPPRRNDLENQHGPEIETEAAEIGDAFDTAEACGAGRQSGARYQEAEQLNDKVAPVISDGGDHSLNANSGGSHDHSNTRTHSS